MAKRRKKVAADGSPQGISGEEKIARLLGLLLVKDVESKGEKASLLRRAGFEVSEVASMLNTTENAVMVADYQARKKSG
jgi:hypothetical protein